MIVKDQAKLADFRDVTDMLRQWFVQQLGDLLSRDAQNYGGLLTGCPLFGTKYVQRFRDYCMPTLLAPDNAAALRGWARVVLFTDAESLLGLLGVVRPLEEALIGVNIHLIPNAIISEISKQDESKYWLLGTVQNLLVQMAGRRGMAFHMLQPDHVYNQSYFLNLKKTASHGKAVVQGGISANIATAFGDIERFRRQGALEVPGDDLDAIGFVHMHSLMRGMLMGSRPPGTYPRSTWLAWRARDRLVIHSPHLNAAYLPPQLCRQAPPIPPHTMDSMLPSFMPGQIYVPTPKDGLSFIEVSDARPADLTPLDFRAFALHYWSNVRFDDAYMRFLRLGCEIALPVDDGRPAIDAADAEAGRLFDALAAAKDQARQDFIDTLMS